MNEVKEDIRSYVLQEFLPGESPSNLQDDTPLRTSGILSSVATLQLITFLEEHYKIEVEAHETGVENFDSVADIAAFVVRKKEGRS
ncbi:MAG: acyl carrier protein [Bryobacteraceae bacterium]|nr:acyl carrier protein [Bryobacteraceae bacterium]